MSLSIDGALIMAPCWGVDLPPLGMACVASATRTKGWNLWVHDFNLECFLEATCEWKELWKDENAGQWWEGARLDEIFQHFEPRVDSLTSDLTIMNPAVIGFSVNQTNVFFSARIARKIKELLPASIIVFGGPSADFFPDRRRMDAEPIDCFALGEGESVFPELIARVKRGDSARSIPGLEWTDDKTTKRPSRELLIHPLDVLPTPLFDDYRIMDYSDPIIQRHKQVLLPLFLSRGCINSCAFCNDHERMPGYRSKSPDRVVEQIEIYQRRYRAKHIRFNDLLLNGHLKKLRQLAQLIIDRNLCLSYTGQAVINTKMDDEYLALLKKSGCSSLVFGVESFSDDVLSIMGKTFTSAEATDVVNRCYNAGINVLLNLIVGFPGESDDAFNETLDWIHRHHAMVEHVNSNMCAVLGRTNLELDPESFGIILPMTDHWCQWHTRDGKNTLELREMRLSRLQAALDQYGLT